VGGGGGVLRRPRLTAALPSSCVWVCVGAVRPVSACRGERALRGTERKGATQAEPSAERGSAGSARGRAEQREAEGEGAFLVAPSCHGRGPLWPTRRKGAPPAPLATHPRRPPADVWRENTRSATKRGYVAHRPYAAHPLALPTHASTHLHQRPHCRRYRLAQIRSYGGAGKRTHKCSGAGRVQARQSPWEAPCAFAALHRSTTLRSTQELAAHLPMSGNDRRPSCRVRPNIRAGTPAL